MTAYPPGMAPVVYRAADFEDAIAEVDATIARLDEAMADRVARGQELVTAWEGMAADRFATTYTHRLLGVHHDVLGELRATRRNLETTLDAIRAEDARRARQREDWLREQAASRP